MIDAEVEAVLEAVPGLADRYLTLVEAADGDPGPAAVLAELADYVAELVTEMERHRSTVARCLAAVEAVADSSPDAQELVAWAFLDSLSPRDRDLLEPWLGPRARSLLGDLEPGPLRED